MDAYRIGVQIAMSSNASAVLGTIQRDMFGLHRATNLLTGHLNAAKIAAVGAMAAISGGAALAVMGKLVEAGKELNKELNRTAQLGGEFASTLPQARAAAIATSIAVPTSLPSENVKLQREIGTQLGNPTEAAGILPMLAKAAYVAHNYTGEDTEAIIKNLTKVADLRGQIFSQGADGKEHVDSTKLQAEVEAAVKGLILGGGFIKSNDMVQLARQGGAPAKLMSPEAFYADMVEMSVSQGAARTGTAVTSLFSQFAGGSMTKRTAEEMAKMGLLRANEFTEGRGGHIVVNREATQRLGSLATDPVKLVNDVVVPALAAHGVVGKDVILEVFKLFGRQTTQRFISELVSNAPQFARAREIVGGIPGVEPQYQALQNKDLDTNIKSFGAAWHGLLEVLGEAGIPAAIGVLHSMTDALNSMKALAADHQQTAAVLLEVGAGVAALATAAGAFAVGTAAVSALAILTGPVGLGVVAVGLIALAGAVVMFKGPANPTDAIAEAATNEIRKPAWMQTVEDFHNKVQDTIKKAIVDAGTYIADGAKQFFNETGPNVVKALGGVAESIIAWARGIPGSIAAALGGALGLPHGGPAPEPAHDASGFSPHYGAFLPDPNDPNAHGYVPHDGARSYAPPAPDAGTARERHGDITLDGQRLGRWIRRDLARDMSGPQYGMLGFDPTMQPGFTGSGAG